MFWGIFLIIFGALILLDRWDIFYGGLVSKLVISGLIAWGGSLLLEHRRGGGNHSGDAVGEGKIESTSP
jgi:hypothetical protein